MDSVQQSKDQELDLLKLIYYEILDGASFDPEKQIYVKHFGEQETCLILQKKQELLSYYIKEGIPSESELLKNSIKNEEWSEEKENQILTLRYLISDNEKAILNIIIQQRQGIENILKIKRKELAEILFERRQVLGKSIESTIEEDINEYVIFLSLFKNKNCTESIFNSYEEFQKQDVEEIIRLNDILSKHCAKINDEIIQKISCLPFFLNKLSYCKDNIYYFLQKPIAQFTYHQSYLFYLGTRNLVVASQSKGNPPELHLNHTLDNIVQWYNREFALMTSKAKKV